MRESILRLTTCYSLLKQKSQLASYGSLYNCPAGVTSCDKKVVPIDNFARKNDVLTSLAFKLDGNGELFIIRVLTRLKESG